MLKKIMLVLAVMLAGVFAAPQSANAAPILTQEFLFEDGSSFGLISIDLDDIVAGEVLNWDTFVLFGFDIGESFGFFADYDPANLAAGFSFLYFDVNDISGSIAFQGIFDTGLGFMDIFEVGGDLLDSGNFTLSRARLVSEPATLFLMLGAAGGLLLRRRRG